MERKTMQKKAGTGHEGGCCARRKVVLNSHSRFGTALGCALLSRVGRIVVLLMSMAVTFSATGSVLAQLAGSPWPMRGHDAKHTAQSQYKGPTTPILKWKFETGDDVNSSPAIGSDGTIYVGSWDDHLYALNPDGSLKWKFKTGGSVFSSPTIGSDGTVYVGSRGPRFNSDSYLYAITPDGSLKWKFKTGGSVDSSPAIGSDGTVYVKSIGPRILSDSYLYAVTPDGNLKWKFETGSYVDSSPAIDSDGTVYVGASDNYLYALNPDGSMKWKFETGGDVDSSPAIGSDGMVYVGSDDNYLYVLNSDGSLKWKFETGSYVDSSPAIGSDATVYVGSDDGGVYALEKASGPKIALLKTCLSFDSVPVRNSKQMTITVFNAGDASLSVSSISSSSSEFFVSQTSFTVNVDSSQEVIVTFTPLSAASQSATLTITSNDPSNPSVIVSLMGNLTLANSPWPMRGHDAKHTGQSPYKGPQTEKLKWKFETGGSVESYPVIESDGTVYVGSNDHYLYALNPDGSLKWKFQTTAEDVNSSPAIGSDGTIYVGSGWSFYAVNPDGNLKWKLQTSGSVLSSPAIGSDGTIYVGSQDNSIYALNPDSTLKWKFQTGDCVTSSPAIGSDGTVYVGSWDGHLYAINPNGSLKWKFETGGQVTSSPAIGSDGTVYVGWSWGRFYAVNPGGNLKWEFETGTVDVVEDPAIGLDGTVYVGSWDGHLYAINPDGSLRWKFKTEGRVSSSPAIGSDGTIYMGSYDNHLYALSPNGSLKWKFKTRGCVYSSPAIGSDETVYVGSNDGGVYAFGIRTWNVPPVLQAGSTLPETGHEKTEFVFSVTYVDADNDKPSKVTVKIDDEVPKTMTRRQGNESFTKGVVYEYRTKLSTGEHTFSFAASDGLADATGDTALHSGPTVVENTPPVLSNGTVWPQTGTKSTEFRFTVIYSDVDNDAPSEVAVRIDDQAPKNMYRTNKSDVDYTDGGVYEYRTKLSAGAHTYSFAAKDWSAHATGDTVVHSGPTITSLSPPVLSNGNVTPQIGTPATEFTFAAFYTNIDDEPPSEVTVMIDGGVKAMEPLATGTTDYAKGVVYQYTTKLALGTHTHAFAAKSGGMDAVGDTGPHAGPLVSSTLPAATPVPGLWKGVTSQGHAVSFIISDDGKSILNFSFTVSGTGTKVVSWIDRHWEDGVLVTETMYSKETYFRKVSGTINQTDILNESFRETYSAESDSATVSGTFTSSILVEGSVNGSTKVPSSYEGTVDVSGSGTWSASPLSSIAINEPKDGALLNSSPVKVSGVTAGGLVSSAEINGTLVQPTHGSFSTSVSLVDGANSINLTAFDADRNIVGTYSVRVTLDSTPPVVTITEPKETFVTDDRKITIKGTVDDPSILYVDVNGVPVCVVKGQFTTVMFLSKGLNHISAKATDEAGNLGSAEVTMTFKPAAPPAPWDINQDGVVDILDLTLIGKHYGESPPKDARVDVNGDGTVDILDLVLVENQFGEKTD